jgi:hypothetical protein
VTPFSVLVAQMRRAILKNRVYGAWGHKIIFFTKFFGFLALRDLVTKRAARGWRGLLHVEQLAAAVEGAGAGRIGGARGRFGRWDGRVAAGRPFWRGEPGGVDCGREARSRSGLGRIEEIGNE